jgi:hypothetical protein
VGPDWVAASVRARAIAERHIGAGRCNHLANAPTLADAFAELTDTMYGARLDGVSTLDAGQMAISATVLWQLRVLAGWMPATGMMLARALAAGFERQNIVAHAEQLRGVESPTEGFDLGTLATGWPQIRATASLQELTGAVRRSGWGDPGHPESVGALADVIAVLWWRRLTVVAPAARSWAAGACALLAARIALVDRTEPSERLVGLMRPLVGTTWMDVRDVSGLTSALPRSVRPVLTDIGEPSELWRAEARLGTVIETDGLRLLRESLPGPDIVLGSLAVLAVDAWRIRAALAAAAAATGTSLMGQEVAHVMA